MRKLLPVVLLLVVAGCSVLGFEQRRDLGESLTLTNETIASTANAAVTALEQGHMSVKDACRIEVYSRLAAAIVDRAFIEWVTGDPESAWEHLDSAKNVLAGSAEYAIAAATEEC